MIILIFFVNEPKLSKEQAEYEAAHPEENLTEKVSETKTESAAPAVAAPVQTIENRQQIIAAVSAAVAEELGTDVSAIRILSFKKI